MSGAVRCLLVDIFYAALFATGPSAYLHLHGHVSRPWRCEVMVCWFITAFGDALHLQLLQLHLRAVSMRNGL
jgi:hypothetical protein